MQMTQTLTTILVAMGGWELVKWLLTRRANKKIATATADQAEIQTEEAEFIYLRKRIEFSEQQLAEKEQRFSEQTAVLRQVQRELLEMTIAKGKAEARVAALEAERSMKLCERRGCAQRQPQSGY